MLTVSVSSEHLLWFTEGNIINLKIKDILFLLEMFVFLFYFY